MDAPPAEFGSRLFIATAALAVGLLTGFAGGYVTGNRSDRGLSPGSPAPPGDDRTASAPMAATDVPAQSYTEDPVPPPPEVVATAEVAVPPVQRTVAARSPSEARGGTLFFDSRPSGAEVFLDERLVGTTPFSLSDVPAGRHEVRIALPEHQRWATSVLVTPGASERVAASLER